MLKGLLKLVLAAIALLAIAVAVNTLRQGPRQIAAGAPAAPLAVDANAVGESLAAAIRARTVSSHDDAQLNADQFAALQAHLAQRYPKVHARLKREVVGSLSLLYTWEGSDPKAPAIALMAHQDVVPIAQGTEGDWQVEPFAGTIKDGFVWGRGAWDDKANLIAELEAVEALLATDFKPRRTVYLVFGADEEVGGERGAKQIAKLLAERGVGLDFVIDEGLLITEGILPGLRPPTALIGVAEKGYLSLQLEAKATPGHSSMPPAAPGTSAIAQISMALARLDAQPMPAAVRGVAAAMFDAIAPEMSGIGRIVMSNRWLFDPLLVSQLEKSASTNAMLRTTTALTIVSAGNKDNVLPGRAEAVVNFRILPGDTQAGVIEHVKRVVDNDRIEIKSLPGNSEPSRPAPIDGSGYQTVNRTVRELFPGTAVAPGLMLGATDSRHFETLSNQVLRFSPVRAKSEDLARFHGTNERIALTNLVELVRFYHHLLRLAAGA
ncbi:MAG: Succinyl-diaminopimelate desuccinylase [Burkholderiaceae bacterium]|nr:Succinyl-diaminopimelate desuccinylase [Burkholderiaceae bacterium]